MVSFTHKISDRNGLHARNAMAFSRMAADYECRIQLGTEAKMADAKNVMALMNLGARSGAQLTCVLEGSDEESAAAALHALAAEIL